MSEGVRVDKWLWAVRIFKTRSKATEACRKGRVEMDELPVKPSREVRSGDVVKVKNAPITKTYKVLDTVEKRVSAKVVTNLVEDITPPEEIEMLKIQKQMNWLKRDKGTGRPTKKDRRDLDEFFES